MTNGEIVEVADVQTKMVRQGEMSALIEAAGQRRRNLKLAMQRVADAITISADIADNMFYAVPRAGDTIMGPSIELAEIVQQNWGSIAVASRVLPPEAERVVAQGIAYDFESLTVVERPGIRSIVTKEGKRFGADLIRSTQMAAASIAIRNAICGIIPRHVMAQFVGLAIRTAGGEEKTLPQRRRAMVVWYQERSVPVDLLLQLLRINTLEEIDGPALAILRGVANAIKAGEVKIEALGTAAERAAELGDSPVAADIMAMLDRVMNDTLAESNDEETEA